MTPHQHANKLTRRQRGSILIPAAAAVLVCVILLGAAQLGLYFSVKREAQNAVDLAALNNVILLDMNGYGDSPSCGDMQSDVEKYIENYPSLYEHRESLSVTCKRVIESNGDYSLDTAATLPANALEVRLDLKAQAYAFFGSLGLEKISATATAYLPPIDEYLAQQRFSVGYTGVRVNEGLLKAALSTVGVNASQVTVLSANGLANLRLTPSGLLQELGIPVNVGGDIGTPTELLTLREVTVGEVLQAAVSVLQQDGLAGVDLGLVAEIVDIFADVGGFNTLVPLFGDGGFLQIAESSTLNAALATQISWAELLNTSVYLANSNNLLDVDLSLGVPGVVEVKTEILLIEPPGSAPLIKDNRASHGNARLYVKLDLLGGLLSLPLIVELGQGTAVVTDVEYNRATLSGYADFDVEGSLLSVCLGPLGLNLFATANSCASDGFRDLSASSATTVDATVVMDGETGPYTTQELTSPLSLSGLVSDVIGGIKLSELLGQQDKSQLCRGLLGLLDCLLSPVLNIVDGLLSIVLAPLDLVLNAVLSGVLNLLGLNIGTVEVTVDDFSGSNLPDGVLIHNLSHD